MNDTKIFTERLSSLIKEKTEPSELPANFLGETLSMGREAVYRRLRGEVPLTFEEMVKIAHRLNVSLDEIAYISEADDKSKWATINLDSLTFFPAKGQDYTKWHYENLKKVNGILESMQQSSSLTLRVASLTIPYFFILNYKYLSLFRHYKWMFLSQDIDRSFTFDKMALTPAMLEQEAHFINVYKKIDRIIYIIDKNIFGSMINDICYFFQQNLISDSHRAILKSELLDLLAYMEKTATKGNFDSNSEINFYLSNVSIDSNYMHLENSTQEFALNYIYYVDVMIFPNLRLCKKQKKWIELFKRYSTHITQTGEKERYEFFLKQRELIENSL